MCRSISWGILVSSVCVVICWVLQVHTYSTHIRLLLPRAVVLRQGADRFPRYCKLLTKMKRCPQTYESGHPLSRDEFLYRMPPIQIRIQRGPLTSLSLLLSPYLSPRLAQPECRTTSKPPNISFSCTYLSSLTSNLISRLSNPPRTQIYFCCKLSSFLHFMGSRILILSYHEHKAMCERILSPKYHKALTFTLLDRCCRPVGLDNQLAQRVEIRRLTLFLHL